MYIPEKIQSRAEDILCDLDDFSNLNFTATRAVATVQGSYPYRVELWLDEGKPSRWHCSCPFDYGDVCKHVAAFWLGLDRGLFAGLQRTQKAEREQLSAQLKQLRKRDLIKGLLEVAEADASLLERLQQKFVPTAKEENVEKQIDRLDKALARFERKNEDSFGYMDAGELANVFRPYLKNLEYFVTCADVYSCWVLAKAIIEKVFDRYDYVDHSSEDLGEVMYEATEALLTLREADLDETLHFEVLDYCIYHIKQGTYSELDLHVDLMQLACALVTDEDELADVAEALENVEGPYATEQSVLLRLDMYRRLEMEEEAAALMSDSLQHQAIRAAAIKSAFAKTDYDTVVELARGGLTLQDQPGYFEEWSSWLLRVAELQGNKEEQVALLCSAYVDDYDLATDALPQIKAMVNAKKWQLLVDELLLALDAQRSRFSPSRTDELLAFAERYDVLAKRIFTKPTHEFLNFGAKHLPKQYHKQLALAYLPIIDELLKRGADTHLYPYIVDSLKRVRKLGATKEARSMEDMIRSKYKRRVSLVRMLGE